MGSLCVADCIDLERTVVFVRSCVHGRLWRKELISFTDNSRFLSWIQMRGYG